MYRPNFCLVVKVGGDEYELTWWNTEVRRFRELPQADYLAIDEGETSNEVTVLFGAPELLDRLEELGATTRIETLPSTGEMDAYVDWTEREAAKERESEILSALDFDPEGEL